MQCRRELLQALRRDGRRLSQEQRDTFTLTNLFTPEKVQKAIEELQPHSTPGADGWTAEYFKVVGQAIHEGEKDRDAEGESGNGW